MRETREALHQAVGRVAVSLFPLIVLGVIWEALSRSGLVSSRLMPSVVLIGQAFYAELLSGELAFHASASLFRALTGFGLAVVVGVILPNSKQHLPTTVQDLERYITFFQGRIKRFKRPVS